MNSNERQQILSRYRARVSGFQLITTKLERRARLVEGTSGSMPPPPLSTSASRAPTGAALSGREIEVIDLVAQGLDNAEIGKRLSISGETVKRHLQHCFAKLGARNRAHAVWLALLQDRQDAPSVTRSTLDP